MKLNPKCMTCQLRKQEAKIRHFDDEDRKKQYMEKSADVLTSQKKRTVFPVFPRN